MKTKSENLLPKTLSGTVHEQFVRCGKSNCSCAKGELHGPYFYHFARIDGLLKKRYLKPSEVEAAKAACQVRLGEKQRILKNERRTWEKLRKLREELRRVRNLCRRQKVRSNKND
jgi:hypothetical protein